VSGQIVVLRRHQLFAVSRTHGLSVDSHRDLPVPAVVSVLLLSLARIQSVGLVLSTAVVLSHSVAESTLAAVRYCPLFETVSVYRLSLSEFSDLAF